MNEDRIIEIEIKLARQEDLVESLNQMVYQQQKKIDELAALCAALVRRTRDMSSSDSDSRPIDEKPPHY